MSHPRNLAILLLLVLLTSCAQVEADSPTQIVSPIVYTETLTSLPSPTPTVTALPTSTLPAMDDFMKGLVYYPTGWGGDQRPETDWILEHIAVPTGANWIQLHVPCSQDNVESTKVYFDPQQSISDEEYIHLVKTAHSLGLRVMSEHYINSSGWANSWSGEIGNSYNEQQWAEWFTTDI